MLFIIMLNKLSVDIINKIIKEVNADENRKIINNNLINPLSNEIISRIFPYLITTFCIYILILIFIILIMIILIQKKNTI